MARFEACPAPRIQLRVLHVWSVLVHFRSRDGSFCAPCKEGGELAESQIVILRVARARTDARVPLCRLQLQDRRKRRSDPRAARSGHKVEWYACSGWRGQERPHENVRAPASTFLTSFDTTLTPPG